MQYHIKDVKKAKEGKMRVKWAESQMPVLCLIKEKFKKEKPLRGVKIGCCLHVTTETANLVTTLKNGGAQVFLCASNPLSTQDDVASHLVIHHKIPVFAIKGESNPLYYQHIKAVLKQNPQVTMDDGADLVSMIHSKRKDLIKNIIGGTEETTTGVIRLRSMEKKEVLGYPIIAVNDADTKHLFDNRYGTGQSTMDGIVRATNILVAGKNVVVCGYGWCGRGVAMRAKGMGANVIVIETNSLRALEAIMDGYWVMPLNEAARLGDIFITLTGDINVLREEHFNLMKDGVIICNSGHFNVEINLKALKKISKKSRQVRDFVKEYTLSNGRKINLIAEGRLVNLSAAEGHPASVMDMSFANQVLCAEFLVKGDGNLAKKVYPVPRKIDIQIAQLKLKSMGIKIDTLTPGQKEYLSSWQIGT